MPRGDRRHARRAGRGHGPPVLRALTGPLLVAALLVAAVAAWQLDLGPRWFGWDGTGVPGTHGANTGPASVSPPPGLDLPAITPAEQVAATLRSGTPDPAKVAAALRRSVRDPKLGRHLRVLVEQLDSGRVVYQHGQGPVTPASTTKLLTTTAALKTLGADHRFDTTVRLSEAVSGLASGAGRVVTLVGGGDPYLSSRPVPGGTYPERADVPTLARETAEALKGSGRARVRVAYDSTLFGEPTVSPAWPKTYVPEGVVAPITALWVDEGRDSSGYGRVSDPPRTAAEVFVKALEKRGVKVVGRPTAHRAPRGSQVVAKVSSAPLGQIVQHVLDVSDNEAAEVLGHHVGLATGGRGTFADGVSGVRRVLTKLGVDLSGSVFHDGSGLSRKNALDPRALAQVLRTDASQAHPQLREIVTGLPVAGFTGSLAYRFDTGSAYGPGLVRAKTGTLTGVHGLAGLVTDRDGDEMVFVALADKVKLAHTLDARQTIDELAAALAGCRCGPGGG